VAALELERDFVLVEKEEKYVDMIKERLTRVIGEMVNGSTRGEDSGPLIETLQREVEGAK
jgi:DNA modification methylase